MKRFDFGLDRYQLSRLLSSFRSKKDVIVFWMNAIKLITSYVEPDFGTNEGNMVLYVDKMSRIFLSTGDKSLSIAFPFSVYENENGLEFGSAACPIVDSKITSDILSLINGSGILSSRSIISFADPLLDIAADYQDIVWELLLELMLCDDGYLRVDHDPANENGNLHPLDHIDIFYSQSSTFKIGLSKRATLDDFRDILDSKSDCHFLRSA